MAELQIIYKPASRVYLSRPTKEYIIVHKAGEHYGVVRTSDASNAILSLDIVILLTITKNMDVDALMESLVLCNSMADIFRVLSKN
jgi:hypothetical protein